MQLSNIWQRGGPLGPRSVNIYNETQTNIYGI